MAENDIFWAIADPTRRAIFEKLAAGSANPSRVRDGMEISRPAMSQHLAVPATMGLTDTRPPSLPRHRAKQMPRQPKLPGHDR